MPALAAGRRYWYDDYNDTLQGIGVNAYYEAILDGKDDLTGKITLTYIPGTIHYLAPNDYTTRVSFMVKDGGNYISYFYPSFQIGMTGQFTITNVEQYAHTGYHIVYAECEYYVNGDARHTIVLP